MTYFFDSYAIIEMSESNPCYEGYKEFEIITSVLNIGEIYQIILRKKGKEAADNWFKKTNFKLLEITPEVIIEGIYFRHSNKKNNFSLPDAVGYKLSLKHNLKFLTGDKQFENMPNAEFVKNRQD
ncbi:PIN domain-containing protein [Candidatus Woesearchaeota archaeon]|nr:PIN domain-containing protein [Candidatus Woesearchaeota archaeon]